MKEESGNVSIPYSLINKLHAFRAVIGKKNGKTPTLKSIVIAAIQKYLETYK